MHPAAALPQALSAEENTWLPSLLAWPLRRALRFSFEHSDRLRNCTEYSVGEMLKIEMGYKEVFS